MRSDFNSLTRIFLGLCACCGIANGQYLAPRPLPPEVATKAPQQVSPPKPTSPIDDGPAYSIDRIVLSYAETRPGMIPIETLSSHPYMLGKISTGYVTAFVPKPGGGVITRTDIGSTSLSLNALIPGQTQSFHASAIRSIEEQLVDIVNANGIYAVYVTIDSSQIVDGRDLRANGDTSLHLIIHVALVTGETTEVSGNRIPGGNSGSDRAYGWIISDSPIQPATTSQPTTRNLFQKVNLDDFLDQLNRYPNRNVAAEISPAANPDEINLNYLIQQDKPWTAYFQLSNTGTPQSNLWRERYGFVDSQLTGHDDTLSFDYSTAEFSQQNSFQGSYEYTLQRPDLLRIRPYMSYSDFQSSELGLPGPGFTGHQTEFGSEVIANVYQQHEFFLDALAGLRYEHIWVNNTPIATTGWADLIEPYAGLRFSQNNATSSFSGETTMLSGYTNTGESTLQTLGRPDVDQHWVIFQGDASMNFYLEPLLNPVGFENGQSVLANEVAISMRGQEAFSHRLIPQLEDVAGGLYSVRGYPQSAMAGDSVYLGSIEYKIHIPHLLAVNPNPPRVSGQPFRTTPQQIYGPTDWDVIPSVFLDAGEVLNTHQEAFEQDATLVGAGVGLELDLKRNMSLKLDWGFALHAIGSPAAGNAVSKDSSHFNLVLTVSY